MDERMAVIDMHRSSTCPGSIPSKENLGENQIALINENAASFIGSAVAGYAHLGERTVGARHAGRSASRSRGVAGKSAARDYELATKTIKAAPRLAGVAREDQIAKPNVLTTLTAKPAAFPVRAGTIGLPGSDGEAVEDYGGDVRNGDDVEAV